MAYCTQAQIEDRIGPDDLVRLADYDEDSTADAVTVTQAIEGACGLIDAYLQPVFVVPIPAPIPDVIRRLAIDLAICELRRGRDSMTESAKEACEEALATLQKIVDGTISVGLIPLPAESESAPTVRYTGQERQFGRDEPL